MASKAVLIAAAAGLAYVFRSSWLPSVEGSVGLTAAVQAGTAPSVTNYNAVNSTTPGGVPLGTSGCFSYGAGTLGAGQDAYISCPPGVSPPAGSAPVNNCPPGFTLDAAGICTRYPDAVLLAQLNTIPWTGLSDIPAEQIQRIDPQILATYSTTVGVNSGTALAYMLGLGTISTNGQMMQGSDGFSYQAQGGVWIRQGTGATLHGLGRLGAVLTAALPITNATLIEASVNPAIAQLVGDDPRAMLTVAQWNYYYSQAAGTVATGLHDDSGVLMSAAQYQMAREAAGLPLSSKLGVIRNARKGAFPLGGLGLINQWVPPGNRSIYRIPGRGAVPAGRGGSIPPPRMGVIHDGGGNHRWARSPFPRPSFWREAE